MILDIHTHSIPPRSEALISMDPGELPAPGVFPDQLWSVGVHPWHLPAAGMSEEDADILREVAARADVVAIGECGIDLARKECAPLFAQMLAFRKHIELSESLGLPLIIHCVRAHDHILDLKRGMRPAMPWAIHGFRGKPSIARMLSDAGIYLSFGERFNPESLAGVPTELILAETDESPLPINGVISALAAVRPDVSPALIAANSSRFLLI